MSYDCFSNGLLRKNLLGQHPGQHCAKLARGGRCHDARRRHAASIAPERLSELLNESARQAKRDRLDQRGMTQVPTRDAERSALCLVKNRQRVGRRLYPHSRRSNICSGNIILHARTPTARTTFTTSFGTK
jgi:hypothetical protein